MLLYSTRVIKIQGVLTENFHTFVAIPSDLDVIFDNISQINIARFEKENSRKYQFLWYKLNYSIQFLLCYLRPPAHTQTEYSTKYQCRVQSNEHLKTIHCNQHTRSNL
jgi:hypothetical protein